MTASVEELSKSVDIGLRGIPFNTNPSNLYDPIRYMLSLGGKRMRPVLTLMACEIFSDDRVAAINPAMGLEVFHNFTLLHDDIMDNAPLRRKKQTVHEKWNSNVAILSGDAMFVKSVELISDVEPKLMPEVLRIFLKTALEVCEGQQMDMDFENDEDISIEQYLQMISLKTAVLLGASLKIGAMIGGASASDCQHLYDFGKSIGMVFQLQDDILDVYGDASKFGKQVGGDIVANKKTYLLLKALECAKDEQFQSLSTLLAESSIDLPNEVKVKKVTEIYDAIGVRDLAEAEMDNYYNDAIQSMEKINNPAKSILIEYADKLGMRQH